MPLEGMPRNSVASINDLSDMTLAVDCGQLQPKQTRERGGLVVARQTPNREVLGFIPTGVTMLCP